MSKIELRKVTEIHLEPGYLLLSAVAGNGNNNEVITCIVQSYGNNNEILEKYGLTIEAQYKPNDVILVNYNDLMSYTHEEGVTYYITKGKKVIATLKSPSV